MRSIKHYGYRPVNSHNEWDPLEEVIVGSVFGAMIPAWDTINKHTVPPGEWDKICCNLDPKGTLYPEERIKAANSEREEFIRILESEGVIVRRIEEVDYTAPFSTPHWSVTSGFSGANPRDPFLIIGNEIIETPMADIDRKLLL